MYAVNVDVGLMSCILGMTWAGGHDLCMESQVGK